MTKNTAEGGTEATRTYATRLRNCAVADVAAMSEEERDSSLLGLKMVLELASPMREKVFVEMIVQEIREKKTGRAKKAPAAA